MKYLLASGFAFLLICTAFIFSSSVDYSKGIFKTDNPPKSAIISVNEFQYTPQIGDTVDCDDGSTYRIVDVSRYTRTYTDPSALEPLPEAFSPDSLEADAIHFTDISGDYLFVKNRYEIVRMLCTLNESAEASGICIQFSIPEDAVPTVQESWDPEQMVAYWNVNHAKTCCLEAWDLYKDGAFRRTVYLTAVI